MRRFPFHQGRFQGRKKFWTQPFNTFVSIPPRKVSRGGWTSALPGYWLSFPFHQGRFQGICGSRLEGAQKLFPFHQGRFQGANSTSPPLSSCPGFHSTKEGFKEGTSRRFSDTVDRRFHSTKEGFKEDWSQGLCSVGTVSIPPRKVSRTYQVFAPDFPR